MIIDRLRPCVCYLLAEVWLIANLEFRYHLFDGSCELFRCEGNASHVVDLALKLNTVCLQELDCCVDAVINVDHG